MVSPTGAKGRALRVLLHRLIDHWQLRMANNPELFAILDRLQS